MDNQTTKNNSVLLRLDFPFYKAEGETDADGPKTEAFRKALRAVYFTATEGVNRLYEVEAAFYLPDAVNPGDVSAFLGLKAALRVENRTTGEDYDVETETTPSAADYADGSWRMFFGMVTECEYLGRFDRGVGDGYHFYRVVIRPTLHHAQFSHPIRTYMNPLQSGGAFTYKDVIGKALAAYNDEADAKYYDGKGAGGQSGGEGRPGRDKVNFDLSEVDVTDARTLSPRWAVQYEESYYNFVLRILERQGWHYCFSFEDAEKLVYEDEKFDADDPMQKLNYVAENVLMHSSPRLRKLGVKTTQFVDYQTQSKSGLGISGKLEKRRLPVTQVTVKDYDPERPQVAVTATYPKNDASARPNPVVLENEFFDVPKDAEKVARIRYEELAGSEAVYRMTANLPGARPGLTFVLRSEIPKDRLDNPDRAWAGDKGGPTGYFITRARHRGVAGNIEAFVRESLAEMLRPDGDENGNEDGGEESRAPKLIPGYSVWLECVPYSENYHAPRTVQWNRMARVVPATTLSLKAGSDDAVAVLDDGRYFIKFKGSCTAVTDGGGGTEDELVAGEDGSVGPLRIQSPMAARMAGTSYYLNAGTEVLVTFVGGNPERPLLLGPVPNPDTAKTVLSNAVETILEGGMAARLGGDTENGGGYFGVGPDGGQDVQQMIVQGAASFSKLSSTFASTNALALNGASYGLASTLSGAFNVSGVAAGFAMPSVIALLNDLLGVANQSMSVASRDIMTDEQNVDAKSDMQAAKMAFSKTPVLVGLLQLFMGIGGMQNSDSRVTITADAESAQTIFRGAPVTKFGKAFMIVNYATKLIEDVLLYYNNIMDRKAANDQSKSLSANGQGMFYQEDGYHIAMTTIDATSMLLEALAYAKLLNVAITEGTGNNGIRIVASAKQPETSPAKILWGNIKNIGKGIAWSTINPTSKFTANATGNNGMDIKMIADGQIDVMSQTRLVLATKKNSPAAAAPGDPVNPGSHIMLESGAGRPVEKIALNSNAIRLTASDCVSARADSAIRLYAGAEQTALGGAHADLVLDQAGDALLAGSRAGSLTFDGSVTITSGNAMTQKAKNVIIGVTDASGGLVMGYFNDQNTQIAGKPYFSLGLTPSDAPSVLAKQQSFDAKRKECINKSIAVLEAEEELDTIVEQISEHRGKDALDEKEALLLANLEIEETAAKAKLQEHTTQLELLKTQLDPLREAVEAEKFTANQQKASMVNGTSDSEKVEVASSSVTVESGTTVTIRAGDKGSIVLDAGGVTIKGGSVKAVINGTAGMVQLA